MSQQKMPLRALEGLGPSLGPNQKKKWAVIGTHPPLSITWGRRECSPLGVLGLMIFIGSSAGLRQAFGTQIFKKTCTLMVCDVPLLRTTSVDHYV